MNLQHDVDEVAEQTSFSGVVSVDLGGDVQFSAAFGLASRTYDIANTPDTRFGTASGAKGPTALVVISLVEDGLLTMSTTARSVLGADLPLIGDDVTIEHLLAHTSGIGDYIDEEDGDLDLDTYLMPVPVQQLASAEDYLAVLDGFPTKFSPGERFSYCNAGYVVLALIAERASGISYYDLIQEHVLASAGMHDSGFFRSDELPVRTATGYLAIDGQWRSNTLHLPVRGCGDGGLFTTVADMSEFWRALFAGRIVSPDWVAEMVRPRSDPPNEDARYGLGFWLDQSSSRVMLVGEDAGVSFYSSHLPETALTYTVISNTADGAWPLVKLLNQSLTS
jgi:CubicO group peptidase (beta-lactamase class C family)